METKNKIQLLMLAVLFFLCVAVFAWSKNDNFMMMFGFAGIASLLMVYLLQSGTAFASPATSVPSVSFRSEDVPLSARAAAMMVEVQRHTLTPSDILIVTLPSGIPPNQMKMAMDSYKAEFKKVLPEGVRVVISPAKIGLEVVSEAGPNV